jgi:hypothetical protein
MNQDSPWTMIGFDEPYRDCQIFSDWLETFKFKNFWTILTNFDPGLHLDWNTIAFQVRESYDKHPVSDFGAVNLTNCPRRFFESNQMICVHM